MSVNDVQDEVRARRIVLVDEYDEERAVLEIQKGMPILSFFSKFDGHPSNKLVRVGIDLNELPALFLYSPESSFSAFASKDGHAGIVFGASKRQVSLVSNPDYRQTPTLSMTDSDGKEVAHLPIGDSSTVSENPLVADKDGMLPNT